MTATRWLGHHGVLCALLTALVVVNPILQQFGVGRAPWEVVGVLVMLVAVVRVADRRVERTLLVALFAAAWLLGRLPEPDATGRALGLAALGCTAAFFATLFVVVVGDVLRQSAAVTAETLFEAINGYLLLGIFFAYGYALLCQLLPDALALPDWTGSAPPMAGYLYYSFVTLTTLGYGDVLPRSPATAALAYFEAVVGQMYVAVMIARLVGLYPGRSRG